MSTPAYSLVFHVDINTCYVSCERILDPSLRDQPVVILSNNDGCIIALDSRAKRLGFSMGDPWHRVADAAAARGVAVRSSNYELYGNISQRVMSVLKEFAADFEQYSIDEAFLTIPATPEEAKKLARKIKDDLARRVGVPVCVGVARTKTLAKLANKTAKKIPVLQGVCVWDLLPPQRRESLFATLPVSEVWGVGGRSARKLAALGIVSIGDLARADLTLIRKRFSVVLMRTVLELRGVPALPLEEQRAFKDQLIFSRSFSTPISDETQMRQVLSLYAQKASARLVKAGQVAGLVAAFCSTSLFSDGAQSHPSVQVKLAQATADPVALTRAGHQLLTRADFGVAQYVRAGFLLSGLEQDGAAQVLEPFELAHEKRQVSTLLVSIQEKCGQGTIGLGYAGLAEQPAWNMKRQMLSPRGTTHWKELVQVKL